MQSLVESPLTVLFITGAIALGCSKPKPAAEPEHPKASLEIESQQPDPVDVEIEGDHLVIHDHINFTFDSDEILDSSGELLDHIAVLLRNHAEIGAGGVGELEPLCDEDTDDCHSKDRRVEFFIQM